MFFRKFTIDEVIFLEKFDKFGNLCGNRYLEWYILENLITKDWRLLSKNINITIDIIENKKYPWHYDYLSSNPNLTWQFIVKNIDKPWNWQAMSRNKFDHKKDYSLNRYFNRILKKDNRLYTDLINFVIQF